MREILFRGKKVDNGEWVVGWYSEDCGYSRILGSYDDYDVVAETIGQYTGMKDKDGVEIYEGDIVRCEAVWDKGDMVVIFEQGEFQMILVKNFKNYIPLCGYYCIRNFTKEVIGNIHDNPELMEVANDNN